MLKFLTDVQSTASVRLTLWLGGTKVGSDAFGNVYYTMKPRRGSKQQRRFVLYKSGTDAAAVPAEWHGWLHHQTDTVPAGNNPLRRTWQKPHQPNLTGTSQAYQPQRATATGDYQPWSPSE
mgnify:CR=1 FL=1